MRPRKFAYMDWKHILSYQQVLEVYSITFVNIAAFTDCEWPLMAMAHLISTVSMRRHDDLSCLVPGAFPSLTSSLLMLSTWR